MDSFVRMISFFTRKTTIDNWVFWIHYRLTFVIVVVFATIVGFKVHLGQPIQCISRYEFPQELLNSICWLQSTYTWTTGWEKKVGREVPYPGVYKYIPGESPIYYNNYNWVFLALCLQAIFFYLPRFFWKRMEGGKIYLLTLALRSPFLSENEKESKKHSIAEYMASNRNNHILYFVFYVLAELMNFVNVVAQIIFMNAFLGGGFSSKALKYGKDMWSLTGRSDDLLQVFPRFTHCSAHHYGSSGDVIRTDAICILPINHINEKIYVFLWFWCIALAIISILALVYRALTIIPNFRTTITSLRVRMANVRHLETIVNHCGLGDWLILDLLARNLDPLSFRDVVEDLVHRLGFKFV